MSERRMLTFEVEDASLWDLDGLTVDGLVEWAKKIQERVPEEYRQVARVEYDSGSDWPTFRVFWSREETAEEEAARIQAEKDEALRAAARQEASERAAYKRLKAKYG
jgi:hypothetical protein